MERWEGMTHLLRSDFSEEFLAKVWEAFLDTYTRALAMHLVLLERITCAGAIAKQSSGSALHHEKW